MSFSSELLIKVLVVLATAPVMALGLTLLEVKGSAWMQRRPGPLHVGLRGFIFPLATAAKRCAVRTKLKAPCNSLSSR